MTFSAAGAVVWALALSLLPVHEPAAGPTPGADTGLSLSLPGGWTVRQQIPGRGIVLDPPGGTAWPVEIAVWPVSVGVTTPELAAREHERIIGSRMQYRRLGQEPVVAQGMGEGVYVEGAAAPRDGREVTALFAVFLAGGKGYVVGTFAEPADAARARAALIDPILSALSLTGAPPRGQPLRDSRPALPPGPPAGPEPSPAARPPTPSPAGSGAPRPPTSAERGNTGGSATTPIAPLATGDWTAYSHPVGFSLKVPPNWKCEVGRHVVRVSSPDGGGVSILPLVCSGSRLGSLAAEELVRCCLGDRIRPARLTWQSCGGDQRALWLRIEFEWEGRARTGVIGCTIEGSQGLAVAALSADSDLRDAVRVAGGIVASFRPQFTVLPATLPGESLDWTDPSGKLQCDVPEGWLVRGGVSTYDNRPWVSLRGSSVPGPRAWFAWSQPLRPIFRDLTPAMERLGFRDGDPYYSYQGSDRRAVLRMGPATDFVMRYLLPKGLLPLAAASAAVSETEVSGLPLLATPGEKARLVDLRAEGETELDFGSCLVSQAATEPSQPGGFWEAAVLAFGGAAGQRAAAGQALRAAMRSAHVAEKGPGETDEKAELGKLLHVGAHAAGAALWEALLGDVAFAPALDTQGPGPTGEIVFRAPASAAGMWYDIARGQSAGCELPPLGSLPANPQATPGDQGGLP